MKKTVDTVMRILLCILFLGTVVFFAAIGRAYICIDLCEQQQLEIAGKRLQEEAPAPALALPDGEQKLVACGADYSMDISDKLPDTFFYRLLFQWRPSLANIGVSMDMDSPLQSFELEQPDWQLVIPAGYEGVLTLMNEDNEPVFEGNVEDDYLGGFSENGSQTGMLTLKKDGISFDYYFELVMHFSLSVSLAQQQCMQGDVLPVLISGNLVDLPMTVSSDLGLAEFVPLKTAGGYAAYLPVAYNCTPGEWPVTVTVGEQQFDMTVTVVERIFTEQYMTIDQSIADSTVNSAAATEEYRSTIYPLYSYTDNRCLWDGVFIEPVSGYRITTEYGLWRYVNGAYSERHSGVDMACALGTPVLSPQNGEVLFAGFLQLSGNTVVISHGGGVKSMFFHMDSLNVKTGDSVCTGDKIGEVGTTGYSTGPHLHYEVKIGSASIDPMALFDGTSGLFTGLI